MMSTMTSESSARQPGSRARGALAQGALWLACAAALAGCATQPAASRQFDVDAFLGASDSALTEVVANQDFLDATRLAANDCAVMLQSERSGVLESLPSAVRGPAWLLHPGATPSQVWLIVSRADGHRSCHGPLPADAMKALVQRAAG